MYPTNLGIRCCVEVVWLENALYSSQNVEGLNILG